MRDSMKPDELDSLTVQLERLTPAATSNHPMLRTLANRALAELAALHEVTLGQIQAAQSQILMEAKAKGVLPTPETLAAFEKKKEQSEPEGPALWREMHTRARAWKGGDDTAYLLAMTNRLSCPTCQNNWARHIGANPPRFADPSFDYFAWTVDRHNEVRRLQNKPELALAEAAALYPLS